VPQVVALDAMGVLYDSADDVADLLIPYLRGLGCSQPADEIERLYGACSLGQLSSDEFWDRTGVGGRATDEEYCRRHRLSAGVVPLLEQLARQGHPLACISNDVAAWSRLLRQRFGLAERIPTWVVSGEVGIRKPDRAIYDELLARLGCPPDQVILVDDRPRNVDAALRIGMGVVDFGATARPGVRSASSMAQLGELSRTWT
jgi:putative hydrolase of the HAD superfamily